MNNLQVFVRCYDKVAQQHLLGLPLYFEYSTHEATLCFRHVKFQTEPVPIDLFGCLWRRGALALGWFSGTNEKQ